MRTSKPYLVGALLVSFAWMLAGGCSASGDDDKSGPSGGGSGFGGTKGAPTVVDPDAGMFDAGTSLNLHPLCGKNVADGSCVPDDPRACSTFVPPPEPVLGSGGAGGETTTSGGAAGAAPRVDVAGAPSGGGAGGERAEPGNAGQANLGGNGAGGAGGAPDAAAGNGGEGNQNPGGLPAYGCQVARQNNQAARQCVAAGTGASNAPCFTAGDCAPGLACVSDGDAGRCRPYCCDLETDCVSGTYCADRPLRKAPSDISNIEPRHVPVCVPADNCSLEDRYPCPAGSDCRCKGETACMVVRNDGSTACLKPGPGAQGDPCPCAWNHVCSEQTDECVKLCRTDTAQNECGTQKCQASSELPKNFGVCVGPL